MRPVITCSLVLLMLFGLFSCEKKKSKDKDVVPVATDSAYMYAVVDSFVFTGATAEAYYSGSSTNPYVIITAQTGPDSTEKIISLRIDNFPHMPGTYAISATGDAKALYKRSSKTTENADSGSITITSIGNSIRGSFYFYTEHHAIKSGTFSAQ